MRNSIRFSGTKSALRVAMPRWTSRAQRTASTTLANSTRICLPCLDHPATVALDRRIDQFGSERAQSTHRPFLVRTGQPRITRDIRRENRR